MQNSNCSDSPGQCTCAAWPCLEIVSARPAVTVRNKGAPVFPVPEIILILGIVPNRLQGGLSRRQAAFSQPQQEEARCGVAQLPPLALLLGRGAQACEHLHVSQPTISSQIRKLEQSLGEDLFQRAGRGLVLTDTGRTVFDYAEEIFTLGRELVDVVQGRPTGKPLRLTVGVPDVLPKLITYRLLEPAFEMTDDVHVVCYEGKLEDLMAELSLQRLDLVLSDTAAGPQIRVKAFNHFLGECGITFFATPEMAQKYRQGFPQSLDQAPLLLPTRNTAVRRSLEQWFDSQDLRPRTIGEFEDSGLLKVFGQAGKGIFPAPTAIEKEIRRQYAVEVIGHLDAVRERFYAISVERRLMHPAVVAITDAARTGIFQTEAE